MDTATAPSRKAVDTAIAQISEGRPVVVVDDQNRENEGDLIFAAELASPELMAFLVRHSSGFVCVALPQPDCDRLVLPPMHHTNSDGFGTAYRVTVDAASGIGTGISARDRARTARLLSDPGARPADFTRPGHVVPLAARPGGVLERQGHTEAAVDLTRLAGLRPGGVLCEIVSTREPHRMARRDELAEFCAKHDLVMVGTTELAAYRQLVERRIERVTSIRLPTEAGPVHTVGYRSTIDDTEHLALVTGRLSGEHDVPVHIHVECLPGDVFGSWRCGCARRLDAAMREITARGQGVVIYLRPGGPSAFRTLQVRDTGDVHSPCDEVLELADLRGLAVQILRDLDVRGIRHLHNPPAVRTAFDELTPDAGEHAAPPGEVA
ncbi:3,4-dihydroxy-2-butanone-4-phosphate synthase [Saccharopolyspora pogona]|uniref:3,4-dihydroxy-2-butanone-4-phosphate synthase n=1 Tax=Saccharopolyspora pogona TaxID=333966 RepID=UPI0016851512|nr:3,4-dihydroxy-2-butanone-4-phosphate synthase [Saccharopolyspora pogona]